MGFSVEGLIVSKVLPSWPLTNSLLMKLQSWGSACGLEYLDGDGELSIRCGVKAEDKHESPLPTVQCFAVTRLRMNERLTVQWVAQICLL